MQALEKQIKNILILWLLFMTGTSFFHCFVDKVELNSNKLSSQSITETIPHYNFCLEQYFDQEEDNNKVFKLAVIIYRQFNPDFYHHSLYFYEKQRFLLRNISFHQGDLSPPNA